jgi:hypothetical protein
MTWMRGLAGARWIRLIQSCITTETQKPYNHPQSGIVQDSPPEASDTTTVAGLINK